MDEDSTEFPSEFLYYGVTNERAAYPESVSTTGSDIQTFNRQLEEGDVNDDADSNLGVLAMKNINSDRDSSFVVDGCCKFSEVVIIKNEGSQPDIFPSASIEEANVYKSIDDLFTDKYNKNQVSEIQKEPLNSMGGTLQEKRNQKDDFGRKYGAIPKRTNPLVLQASTEIETEDALSSYTRNSLPSKFLKNLSDLKKNPSKIVQSLYKNVARSNEKGSKKEKMYGSEDCSGSFLHSFDKEKSSRKFTKKQKTIRKPVQNRLEVLVSVKNWVCEKFFKYSDEKDRMYKHNDQYAHKNSRDSFRQNIIWSNNENYVEIPSVKSTKPFGENIIWSNNENYIVIPSLNSTEPLGENFMLSNTENYVEIPGEKSVKPLGENINIIWSKSENFIEIPSEKSVKPVSRKSRPLVHKRPLETIYESSTEEEPYSENDSNSINSELKIKIDTRSAPAETLTDECDINGKSASSSMLKEERGLCETSLSTENMKEETVADDNVSVSSKIMKECGADALSTLKKTEIAIGKLSVSAEIILENDHSMDGKIKESYSERVETECSAKVSEHLDVRLQELTQMPTLESILGLERKGTACQIIDNPDSEGLIPFGNDFKAFGTESESDRFCCRYHNACSTSLEVYKSDNKTKCTSTNRQENSHTLVGNETYKKKDNDTVYINENALSIISENVSDDEDSNLFYCKISNLKIKSNAEALDGQKINDENRLSIISYDVSDDGESDLFYNKISDLKLKSNTKAFNDQEKNDENALNIISCDVSDDEKLDSVSYKMSNLKIKSNEGACHGLDQRSCECKAVDEIIYLKVNKANSQEVSQEKVEMSTKLAKNAGNLVFEQEQKYQEDSGNENTGFIGYLEQRNIIEKEVKIKEQGKSECVKMYQDTYRGDLKMKIKIIKKQGKIGYEVVNQDINLEDIKRNRKGGIEGYSSHDWNQEYDADDEDEVIEGIQSIIEKNLKNTK
ncbi:hypothetical protein JTE90_013461 [Oedothorax gibbosus]|uniref:Uncharacterized protein n=1 Tax=Oedothorax gibbosus TaxID=931172 RepID=A0AAV6VN52_9ARAC|nr:hypothetical protein JTE90_013461 [Oedothorax gibbosus]